MTPRRGYKNIYSLWRLGILRTAIALFAFILVGRLFTLQVIQHRDYSALAAVRSNFSSTLTPERGRILVQDRTLAGSGGAAGEQYYSVATNRTVENLVISPHDISNDSQVAAALAEIFGLSEQELLSGLKNKNREYWLIKKALSEEEVNALSAAKQEERLPKVGIWLEPEVQRYYPEGEFLSQVLGFVGFAGDERKGVYGLERAFEELLAGRPGQIAESGSSSLIAGSLRKFTPAINGSTLVLTIDRAIQAEAERVLKQYVERFGATGGSVLVVDPQTGRVLAMASAPQFNPNEYSKVEDVKQFLNPVVQSRYEPGSVVKPITMAIGLETGAVKRNSTYDDKGSVMVNGHVIKNSDEKIYGVQSMGQILEKSLNTGAVYVQQKVGKEQMKRFLEKFGLKEKTGLTLPGEVSGDLRNLDTNSDIAFATASFGQGISVTPAELVQAFTAIAGGGEMQKLHIVSEIIHPNGGREVVEPQTVRRVISAKTAAEVSSMMVGVVENGHGRRAAVPGYYIAGKTGTAQVPLEGARGYDPDKTIGSFIGFGPVEDPAFVMLVKIDSPQGVQFAENTAAPAFGEIAKFILNYLQIPPTRTLE